MPGLSSGRYCPGRSTSTTGSPPSPASERSTWPGADVLPGPDPQVVHHAGPGRPHLPLGEARPGELPLGAQRQEALLGPGVRGFLSRLMSWSSNSRSIRSKLRGLAGAVEADEEAPGLHPLPRPDHSPRSPCRRSWL